MAASITDGPLFTTGNLTAIPLSFGIAVPDPNQDAGPSINYQGTGLPDVRFFMPKDKLQGYTGVVGAHLDQAYLTSISQIPATLGTANIAALANVVSGVVMTLAAGSVGITLNMPIRPLSGALAGSAVVTAAVALDFGFAFGNCTSGSTTILVADGRDFFVGMALVIGSVGNAGGTIPLLTTVTVVVASAGTNTITVANAPLATNATAPIGMGDIWGPSVVGFPTPLATWPAMAAGPSALFDPRQGVARAVQVVGTAGGTGGTFTVRGWDIWGAVMSETITVGAGAVIGWGRKCFKYIASVTPNFTNANNYSIGTSDIFGFAYRNRIWEKAEISWNGAKITANTGWLAADLTIIATATTADTRGTVQLSASGGGAAIAAPAASNGTIVSLAMSGRRLEMAQFIPMNDMVQGTNFSPVSIYGSTQA